MASSKGKQLAPLPVLPAGQNYEPWKVFIGHLDFSVNQLVLEQFLHYHLDTTPHTIHFMHGKGKKTGVGLHSAFCEFGTSVEAY